MNRGLDTLIFFVTSRCNARCRTCFYWEELNQPNDLTFEEIERLAATMPRFAEIWLSGGEPTLRPELSEIVSLFHRRNGVRSINLPTNGVLPWRIVEQIEAIRRLAPGMRINLNLALDGFAETHDRIRGVPGNFERALESLEALEALRLKDRELRVHVNSVVCSENLDEMLPLADFIRQRFDLDGHYFQVIRGEPMDPVLLHLHQKSLEDLYAGLRPLYRHYATKIRRGENTFAAYLKRAYYLGALELYHRTQLANLEQHTRWPMACTAGETILVLDANGDLRACELREKLGNLRDFDCNWKAFWASRARSEETRAIARDGCWCTHVCFLHASLKASPKALAVDVPRAYLAQA